MSRDAILHKVRTALGRTPGQAPTPAPPPMLQTRTLTAEERVSSFIQRFEALAGKALRVRDPQSAARWLRGFLNGRSAIAANSPFLVRAGVTGLAGVESGFKDPDSIRSAASQANVGVTCVDYALADTGTIVMLSSPLQARLISLLPPVHVAIFPQSSILTGLDELLTLLPNPAEITSSMVLITGPSRTADIEQILVRGVHGPGEIHAVIVDGL